MKRRTLAFGATAAVVLAAALAWAFAPRAVEVEMARTLTDVLGRRVPLLLRSRDQGLSVARGVAERMARQLDWSEARVVEEVDRYCAVVEETRRFRG